MNPNLSEHRIPRSAAFSADAAADRSVSIIVSPRERFSVARESLLSIYSTVGQRVELIYVDIEADPDLSAWLDEQAELRDFRIVRPGHDVSPNEARNLGLKLAQSRYVVFIDNDVICAAGWLEALLDCALSENADLVAPLTCHGLPVHSNIHHAGGTLFGDINTFLAQPPGTRTARDQIAWAGTKVSELPVTLSRGATESCEYHCVLLRRSVFERIGPLDEKLLATREHNDLCLTLAQIGAKLVFEPRAVVTYLFPSRARPMRSLDWRYFALRWSADWQRRSIEHYEAKWGLRRDEPMHSAAWLNWRTYEGLTKPFVRKVPGSGRSAAFRRVLDTLIGRTVRAIARVIVLIDDRRRRHRQADPRGTSLRLHTAPHA